VLNFVVLALAFWVVCSWRARGASPRPDGFEPAAHHWPLALTVLLLPVAAIIPGAVESRFFLPLHLLAYCVIAFQFDRIELAQGWRRHGALVLVATLALAGMFFAVTLSTMAQMQYGWPMLYRHGP